MTFVSQLRKNGHLVIISYLKDLYRNSVVNNIRKAVYGNSTKKTYRHTVKYHATVASIRTEPVIFLKLNDFHVIQCRFPLSLCSKLLHLYEKVGYLCTVVFFFHLPSPNEFIFIKYVVPCDMKNFNTLGEGKP